jgi:hypothetical protein
MSLWCNEYNLTRNCPSWRQDGDIETLLAKAMRIRRHSWVNWLPSECETKKSLSDDPIMPAMRVERWGIRGGLWGTSKGGGPLYRMGLASTSSPDRIPKRSALSAHGKGPISSLSSTNVGQWKPRKSPLVRKWDATLNGVGWVKLWIPASLKGDSHRGLCYWP